MKSFRFFVLAGVAALLLAGCSTAVSPAKSAKIDPQKTGLVLATLTRTGPQDARVEFTLRRVDGRQGAFTNLAIDATRELSLIEVPVGRYQIAGWLATEGATIAGPGTEPATKPVEFEVRPGEITYLGHLQVAVNWMHNPIHSSSIYVRARPVLEDRSAKTIEAFRQQYPALAAMPVRNVAPQRVALVRPATEPVPWFAPIAQTETRRFDPMPTGPKWP